MSILSRRWVPKILSFGSLPKELDLSRAVVEVRQQLEQLSVHSMSHHDLMLFYVCLPLRSGLPLYANLLFSFRVGKGRYLYD